MFLVVPSPYQPSSPSRLADIPAPPHSLHSPSHQETWVASASQMSYLSRLYPLLRSCLTSSMRASQISSWLLIFWPTSPHFISYCTLLVLISQHLIFELWLLMSAKPLDQWPQIRVPKPAASAASGNLLETQKFSAQPTYWLRNSRWSPAPKFQSPPGES